MEVARTEKTMLEVSTPMSTVPSRRRGRDRMASTSPAPGRVLLFKAQAIQGAQGKEGGFGHGEEGHQEHQDAHGQPADEIGIGKDGVHFSRRVTVRDPGGSQRIMHRWNNRTRLFPGTGRVRRTHPAGGLPSANPGFLVKAGS